MRYLLIYHRRLGDILQLFPACRHLQRQGHDVELECDPLYHDIFACVDYVRPVLPGTPREGYDRVLNLAVHPLGGGTDDRYEAYRRSHRRWSDFVYDIDDIRGSYGPVEFTNLAHCTPASYGLPPNGDYVLVAPFGYSQHITYNPNTLTAWCHARWPGKRMFVLTDRTDLQPPLFIRARRLRDLPAIVSWPRHFASINTSTAIIAAGVRKSYVHFPQTGFAAQDDTAIPGVSESVQPYAGEPLSMDSKVLEAAWRFPEHARGRSVARRAPGGGRPKIAFLTTLNRNVGDEFIREGIRAVLDRSLGEYSPLFICKHTPATISSPVPDESTVVADKYWDADVVVQAGAPVYWHFGGGKIHSLNSEWHQWFWEERVLAGGARRHPVFLNLGAGTCFPWGDQARGFMADRDCVQFARRAADRAALTTVRDPLAHEMLTELGLAHLPMPCPAFLAAARHRLAYQPNGPIGVNLMPLGGHYDLNVGFDSGAWIAACVGMLRELRSLGPLFFVAHNPEEAEFMRALRRQDEEVYCGPSWRGYLDAYSQCSVVVANRVHGAVCAAGFGAPAVVLGNDTRARIGEFIGLPVFPSNPEGARSAVNAVVRLLESRSTESRRLLDLRDATLARYVSLVSEALPALAHTSLRTA